jgi:ribosome-associated translation inhibitor RaiA
MQLPVQITFRNVPRSEQLEELIRTRAAKLDRYHARLTGCHVLVEVPHRHRHERPPFHVRIDLTVPGGEILVNHQPSLHGSLQDTDAVEFEKAADVNPLRDDAPAAIRAAFDKARRRLQDYARRQRGDVKAHEMPVAGGVTAVAQDEGAIGEGRGDTG